MDTVEKGNILTFRTLVFCQQVFHQNNQRSLLSLSDIEKSEAWHRNREEHNPKHCIATNKQKMNPLRAKWPMKPTRVKR